MASKICDRCFHYDVCLLHEDNFIEDAAKNGFCGKFVDKSKFCKKRLSKWVVLAYDGQDNTVVLDYDKNQHRDPFCLVCKGEALLDENKEYVASKHCPHCGAEMIGGKK